MPNKLIITESQFKNLINEELGVANKVIEKTNEIFPLIENSLLNNVEDVEKYDNYTIKKSSINFSILDSKISCSIICYNYFTKEYFDYSNFESTGWSIYLNKKMCFMGISIPSISGSIVKPEAMDTIQHEIEHLFQQILMGKMFSDNTLYAKIKTNMQYEDEIVRKTANLVYGCIKSEQEGFVNGLYSYLMSFPQIFSMDLLKKSSTWKLYNEMCETFNEFKDNPNFVTELKKYNMTVNEAYKCINEFVKKIGKVVVKVNKDKYEKQGWRN